MGGVLASATSLVPSHKTNTSIPVHLHWQGSSVSTSAMIDSGAEGNFIDEAWAREQGIPLIELVEATPLFALDGSPLPKVCRETVPLSLTVSGNHRETTSFLIFSSSFSPIVLGHPWLVLHNPHINWSK